jgi:hypothetical protein
MEKANTMVDEIETYLLQSKHPLKEACDEEIANNVLRPYQATPQHA